MKRPATDSMAVMANALREIMPKPVPAPGAEVDAHVVVAHVSVTVPVV